MKIRHFLSREWEYIKGNIKTKRYIPIVVACVIIVGIITGITNYRTIVYSNIIINGNLFLYRTFTDQSFGGFFELLFSSVFINLVIACFCGVNKWSRIVQYVFLFVFAAGFTAGICNIIRLYALIGILMSITILFIYGIVIMAMYFLIIAVSAADDFCDSKLSARNTVLLTVIVVAVLSILCFALSIVYVLLFRPVFCFL